LYKLKKFQQKLSKNPLTNLAITKKEAKSDYFDKIAKEFCMKLK